MSTLILRKVSDKVVKPIEKSKSYSKEEIQGSDVFELPFGNVFMASQTMSGKTTVLFNMIKMLCNKYTNVIVFCSTIHNDPSWIHIREFLQEKDISNLFYDSIYDDDTGENRLSELLRNLKDEAKQKEERKEKKDMKEKPKKIILYDDSESEDNDDEPKRKPKKMAQKYLLIFDDLSEELRKDKTVQQLCKKSRHFNCRVVLSSQYMNDIDPATMRQMMYGILFSGHGEDKLRLIYRNLDLTFCPFDLFERIYNAITAKKYDFLFIDRTNRQFRKNFDMLIELP